MERTKRPSNNALNPARLQVLSELMRRVSLATRMSTQTYDGNRNVSKALGYPDTLEYQDFMARYQRQDIAKAIIDRPVKATWQGTLDLLELSDTKETELEKAWKDLNRKLSLKTTLSRLDRLACLGDYGVLLLGLNDVKKKEDFAKPVTSKALKLVYVKPFGQGNARIKTYENDVNNARYGLPKDYEITIETEEGNSDTFVVHASRVVHIVTDTLESEIIGTPVLLSVFNRLIDLEKLIGGDAEMFWRGARPGYSGKIDPEFMMTDTAEAALKDQIDEFENNMRRILINEGVDLTELAQQIADPAHHVDIQIQMISAVTGIPKRILIGSERGELSSTQDEGEWFAYVQARRDEHAEPHIVRPFVNKCIELAILPTPKEEGEYTVKWQDLFTLSEKDRVEIGNKRAEALKFYASYPAVEAVIPPDAFLEEFLGLTADQIQLIQEMRKAAMNEELLMSPTPEEEAAMAAEAAPVEKPMKRTKVKK